MKIKPNSLLLGDSLEIIKKMPSNFCDLILTDPPYGISFKSNYRNSETKIFETIANDDNLDWFEDFAIEIERVLKPNRSGYIFTSFKTYPHMFFALQKANLKIANVLCVKRGTKGGLGAIYSSFAPDEEWVIFFHKQKPRKFFSTELCKTDGRNPDKKYRTRLSSVWFDTAYNQFPACSVNPSTQKKRGDKIIHNTEKNPEFLKWLILLSTAEQEIVFDPFVGVGSTAISCIETNRKYIGIELQDVFYNIAKQRVEELINNEK